MRSVCLACALFYMNSNLRRIKSSVTISACSWSSCNPLIYIASMVVFAFNRGNRPFTGATKSPNALSDCLGVECSNGQQLQTLELR